MTTKREPGEYRPHPGSEAFTITALYPGQEAWFPAEEGSTSRVQQKISAYLTKMRKVPLLAARTFEIKGFLATSPTDLETCRLVRLRRLT